jgi:hypothetical protein
LVLPSKTSSLLIEAAKRILAALSTGLLARRFPVRAIRFDYLQAIADLDAWIDSRKEEIALETSA